MSSNSYTRNKQDHCVYLNIQRTTFCISVAYVDDMLLSCEDKVEI